MENDANQSSTKKSPFIIGLIFLGGLIIYASYQIFFSELKQPSGQKPLNTQVNVDSKEDTIKQKASEYSKVTETHTTTIKEDSHSKLSVAENTVAAPSQNEAPEIPEAELPLLDHSDPELNDLVKDKFAGEAVWLVKSDDLIRRVVVYIDNIAQGKIAREHAPFLAPKETFKVDDNGEIVISEQSFKRYTPYVKLIQTLSPDQWMLLYKLYKPLINEAYQELGYADEDFDATLLDAIEMIENTPAYQSKLPLQSESVAYKYQSHEWEALPAAQKQLLRMGPDNAAKVKQYLAELKTHL